MWAFCEVPGRHVSLSLQVGAGETRSDFTGAKVRPPSWGHSGPRLFPNPHPPPTSRLSQHPAAASGGRGQPSPPRGPPSVSRWEEDAGSPWARAELAPTASPVPGRLPCAFLAGRGSSSCRIIYVGPICGGGGAPRWGGCGDWV